MNFPRQQRTTTSWSRRLTEEAIAPIEPYLEDGEHIYSPASIPSGGDETFLLGLEAGKRLKTRKEAAHALEVGIREVVVHDADRKGITGDDGEGRQNADVIHGKITHRAATGRVQGTTTTIFEPETQA